MRAEGAVNDTESDDEDLDIIPEDEPTQSQEDTFTQPAFAFGRQALNADDSEEDDSSDDDDDLCYQPDAGEEKEFAERMEAAAVADQVLSKSPPPRLNHPTKHDAFAFEDEVDDVLDADRKQPAPKRRRNKKASPAFALKPPTPSVSSAADKDDSASESKAVSTLNIDTSRHSTRNVRRNRKYFE